MAFMIMWCSDCSVRNLNETSLESLAEAPTPSLTNLVTVHWIPAILIEFISLSAGSFLGFILIDAFCHPLEAAEVIWYFRTQIDENVIFICWICISTDEYGVELWVRRSQYTVGHEALLTPGPQESVHVPEFLVIGDRDQYSMLLLQCLLRQPAGQCITITRGCRLQDVEIYSGHQLVLCQYDNYGFRLPVVFHSEARLAMSVDKLTDLTISAPSSQT